MLAELTLSLATRAPAALRRLGLVRESIGLWSRSGRQKAAWADHYARCQQVVTEVVAGMPAGGRVLVLGSGLVRDVPVALLARHFDEVLLVDAVHLPLTRLRLRRYRNLRFVTRDLTGIADWLTGRAGGRVPPMDDWIADPSIRLVISANLLSQLPIPVESWTDRQNRAERFPASLPAEVVGWHLADLARFGCPVCLLSDVEMREEDSRGRVTSRLDLMRGHKLPKPDAAWDWPVAPLGEADPRHAYVHRVQAWRDFRLSA